MKFEKFQANLKVLTTKYRAVCEENNWKGKWRDTYVEAERDADRYFRRNPTCYVTIEFQQKSHAKFLAD